MPNLKPKQPQKPKGPATKLNVPEVPKIKNPNMKRDQSIQARNKNSAGKMRSNRGK